MNSLRRILVTGCVASVLLIELAFHSRLMEAQAARLNAESLSSASFPAGFVWTQDISQAPVDAKSDDTIQWLANAGGWGSGRMRVDFSLRVLVVTASTPEVPFRPGNQFYGDDSETPSAVPLPVGGGTEGQQSYHCPDEQQDCHYIVVDRTYQKLYEGVAANYDGRALTALFLAVWDLNRLYPPSGGGDQCTSADAAGYLIAPLLFNADDLAAGPIDHAIRFILPNDRTRAGVFIHPATHGGAPTGPDSALPYGVHLRLKASYDISPSRPAAQIVARAMQKYGMFLADRGTIALTAQNDADTRAKYSDVGFEPNDLQALKVTDFEVLKEDSVIPLTNDCVRND